MVIVGMITTSELSKAFYNVYHCDDVETVAQSKLIINSCSRDVFNEYMMIKNRKNRYRKRLIKLFNNIPNLHFITLTYSDEYIKDYDFYIKRFLKELRIKKISYLCNEDYGSEFGRLHYHLVAPISNYKIKKLWECGWSFSKRIKLNITSFYKISDYCNKLVNHALKDTNKRYITYYKIFL